MNRKEWRRWSRRLNREAADKQLSEKVSLGSFNLTAENKLSRSKYLGANYAFTYKQRSEGRALYRGDFKNPTLYNHTGVDTVGNGHVGYHYLNDVPQSWLRSQGNSFCSIPFTGEAGTWGGYETTVSLRSRLISAAQSAINDKMLRTYASWDALTDAAEMRECVSYWHLTSKRFLEAGRAIATHDAKRFFTVFGVKPSTRRVKKFRNILIDEWKTQQSAATLLSAFGRLNMEFRYAVMPTFYSMQDAINALYTPKATYAYELKAQVTLDDLYVQASTGQNAGVGGYAVNYKRQSVHVGSYRIQAKYSFADSVRNRLLGSPLVAIAKTSYELVPYSFVVDWFYDIGGYLAQLQLFSVLATISVNNTEKGMVQLSTVPLGFISPKKPMIITDIQNLCAGYSSTRKHFTRTRGALVVNPPSLEMGLYSFHRQLDAASMSWSRTKTYLTHTRLPAIKI